MRPRAGLSPAILLVLFAVLAVLVLAIGRFGLPTGAEGPPAATGPTSTAALKPAGSPQATVVARRTRQTSGSRVPSATVPTPLATSVPPPLATSTPPPTSPAPSLAPDREGTPAATPQPARYYTVVAGDTLWGVSRRFGVTVEQLARANGQMPDAQLRIGQRLLIPQPGASAGIALPPVGAVPPAPARADLKSVAPALVRFLNSRAGTTAAAVYVPEENTLYSLRPRTKFEMASTVKLPIMVTQLSQRFRRDPRATSPGTDLLVPMITVSDNDAATALLAQVGGPKAVGAEMRARGLVATRINPDAWGLSTTTAEDMTMLMRSLYYGQRMNASLRGTAFGLMSGVVESQRWGVPQGLPDETPVAFKGGWLPTDDGWLVHQVGVFQLGNQSYVFALYTSEQPSWDYGKETLRRSAELLAGQLANR